jgi:hypothetical protein
MELLFLKLTNKKYQYKELKQVYETPVLERVASIMKLKGLSKE